MKKIDYHCHFSGSLSPAFLVNESMTISSVQPVFTNDWERNTDLFFDTYTAIQRATKSPDIFKLSQLYLKGSYNICSSYIGEGVDEFHLRIGPRLNFEETILRLKNSIAGFEIAESEQNKKDVGKLILTLIHDKTGQFININERSLSILLKYVAENRDISKRVVGFDFSGPEKYVNPKAVIKLLEIISNFNNSNNYRRFEIAIHAGEYIKTSSVYNQFDYLDKLMSLGIDRLSHGTLMWICPKLINKIASKEITIRQEMALDQIVHKQIHLEICPTANKTLSPLESITDIPLDLFDKLGVFYSINTDNKTIFKTSLNKEWGYFPSNMHNPFETAVKGSKMTSLSPNKSINPS